MAANQTTNYQLNQWEAADQVLRTDFNADNAKVDAALAGKVDQAALDNLESTVETLTGTTAALSATHNGRVYAVQGSNVGSGSYLGGGGEAINVSWSGHSMTVSSPSGDASYLCNWSGDRYSVVALLDANA